MTVVLGVDPGFRDIGLAVAELKEDLSIVPLSLHIIHTEPSKDKKRLKSNDNIARARYIYMKLHKIMDENSIKCIFAEAMSFPRSSSAAAKTSLCWGLLAAMSEIFRVNINQVSPQKIKRVVTGLKKASKEEVQAALDKDYPSLQGLAEHINGSLQNHAYDAFGSIVTCVKGGDTDYIGLLYKYA